MIHIDRLRLHLPAGYQGRAREIARLVASELKGSLGTTAGNLERLQVGPLQLAPGAGNRAVARRIATSVTSRVNDSLRGR